ncbi:sialic acid-binding Ig-like lectin 16 isoform X2 [Centroberyx gerrardi]|uniref:sialic acid-binding Ig-like lectin 16 isoform X2 n=1 Tax=Centroberyx gerrardi TaxID=166262 RepID=UPI003AAF77EE
MKINPLALWLMSNDGKCDSGDSGVWSGNWRVTFSNQCAFRGQSVLIQCSYDYPRGHRVTSVTWFRGKYVSGQWFTTALSYQGRFEYLGDKWSNCNLRINNLQDTDEGAYFFQFETTSDRWQSKTYLYLSVTELTAVVKPTSVTEGEGVSLTCVSGCAPQNIVWFRDRQPVTNPNFQASIEDAGTYHCAIRGQETIRSVSVALNVEYGPRKVSLSVSPSRDVVKGSSVTFTCSSDANPAVTEGGYTLYKDTEDTPLASGQNHTISDIQPSHSGLYHCRAWNNISSNGIAFPKSAGLNLDVQYLPENISVSVDPAGRVAEGSSVNLSCSSAANPAADSYTWFRRTGSPGSSSLLQVGSGQMLSLPSMEPSHTGHYLCQARNPLGENNSTELLLLMQEKASQALPILAGVGVTVLVIFLVALVVLLFRKKQKHADKQTVSDSRPSGRGSDSSAKIEQPDSLYANVDHFSSSPSPSRNSDHSGQAGKVRTASNEYDDPSSWRDEVVYSTVTIKPRETRLPDHTDNSLQDQHTQSEKPGEGDDSVIYATVAKHS